MKEVTILSLESPNNERIICSAEVTVAGGRPSVLSLQVDTGASVSVLSLPYARAYFKGTALVPTDTKLYGVGRHPLCVVGTLPATVTIGTRSTAAQFYVVDIAAREGLLGLDIIKSLDLTIQPASGKVACIVPDEQSRELPVIVGYQHRIKLKPDAVPTRTSLRRLPLSVRGEVTAELQRLLQAGIIERTEASQWISPVVVVRKKSGEIRLCVDLRGPNSQLVTEVHPLPTVQELQTQLEGGVFSQLDLRSAYHQLELHPSSRHITAFITHDGLFRFRRVPFGLASAGAACQRLLDNILTGIPGCCHYLDDIVCCGRTQEEHDDRLRQVMQRLQAANVSLNYKKSKFSQSSIEFCGYKVSSAGISPLEDHMQAIKEAPAPADAKELRGFLGLCGWLSHFVPGYASIAAPLFTLLKKGVTFVWTSDHATAFRTLKEKMRAANPLQRFNPDLKTYVTTDASDKGAGAVLSQVDADGKESVVAFWSRRFTPCEQNYAVTEREALAAVNAVEKWKLFLWGHPFILRTDHSALRSILSANYSGRAGARIARWQARLVPYSYSVKYVPGNKLPGADVLSRLPDSSGTAPDNFSDDDGLVIALMEEEGNLTLDEVREASRNDPEVVALRHALLHGFPQRYKNCNKYSKPYYSLQHELSVSGELVVRAGSQLIIPSSLRSRYLELAHAAHDGIVRTKQLLRSLAWWPGMDAEVTRLVTDCKHCQSSDKVLAGRARPAPLQPVDIPETPWTKLGLDIVGPINTAPLSQRYVIVLVDYTSKWPEMGMVSSVESADIIKFLDKIWAREGYPQELVTDNGRQFISEEFEQYLKRAGISHRRSAAYWPRGNAAVERLNRTLKSWLQERPTGVSLQAHVSNRLAYYRATPHCSTGRSPSELLHGRKMRLRLPVIASSKIDTDTYQRVKKQQQRNKKHYDRRNAVRSPKLRAGDYVHVRKPGHVPKTSRRFSSPVRVMSPEGPASYRLGDGSVRNAAHLASAAVNDQTRGDRPAELPTRDDSAETQHEPPLTKDSSAEEATQRSLPPAVPSTDITGEPPPRAERELTPTSSGRRRWCPERLGYC